jgi:hypothetical protein
VEELATINGLLGTMTWKLLDASGQVEYTQWSVLHPVTMIVSTYPETVQHFQQVGSFKSF